MRNTTHLTNTFLLLLPQINLLSIVPIISKTQSSTGKDKILVWYFYPVDVTVVLTKTMKLVLFVIVSSVLS